MYFLIFTEGVMEYAPTRGFYLMLRVQNIISGYTSITLNKLDLWKSIELSSNAILDSTDRWIMDHELGTI